MTIRLVLCALVLVLALPAAASAAGDPKAPRQQYTAADTKRAKAIALRAGDFTAGWRLDPPAKPSPPCTAGPDESKLVQTAKVDPSFTWKDGITNIGSEVDVFRTAPEALQDWRATTLSLLKTCLLQSARSGAAKGVRVRVASAKTLVPPVGAPRTLHYRLLMTIQSKQTSNLVVDVIAIGRGRTTVVLHTLTVRTPLPAALLDALTAKLASRLNVGHGEITA